MTYDAVKSWVEGNIERKMRELGVPHWRIEVNYTRLDAADDGFQSILQVRRRPEYERATIDIDCHHVDDEKALAEYIDHELMHIVHSPFHLFYRLVWEMLPESKRGVLNEAYSHAEEMTVRNMERMAFGLRESAKGAPVGK